MEATLTATVLDCAHRKLVTALQSLEMEKAIQDQSTSLKDYWELTKPTVVALMLLTSVVGMLMAVRVWFPENFNSWKFKNRAMRHLRPR